MKLRDYQREAVTSLFDHFRRTKEKNPLVVAPTGSGKSHILAGFCAEIFRRYPKENVLIITHTKEIIQQDATILGKYLPPELIGIYSAGLNSANKAKFTIASIQSIYKKANLFSDCSLIIVDEAHLIPPAGEGRYRTFLSSFPKVRVVGLTATPYRTGHGMLTEGHIFDTIAYDIKIQYLVDKGYLASLSTKATDYLLDTKGVKVVAGDYSKASLSEKLDHKNITERIIKELVAFKDKRKSWLIFAIDINHCEHITKELINQDIVAAAVHSKLDIDRKHLLDLFKEGVIQALVSVETLTTGFDAPEVDLIVMMRPTKSPVLHVQMLGRGMRSAPGKDVCTVLDFSGNIHRLGPVDDVHVVGKKAKGSGTGAPLTKTCPRCAEIVHIKRKKCSSCGYVFPIRTNLSLEASKEAVLKDQIKFHTVDIKKIRYSLHKKAGKKPSFKVTYVCGAISFYHKWIALEHLGFPRKMAEQWWKKHGMLPVPRTVEEALSRQDELAVPRQLVIRTAKWPDVIKELF